MLPVAPIDSQQIAGAKPPLLHGGQVHGNAQQREQHAAEPQPLQRGQRTRCLCQWPGAEQEIRQVRQRVEMALQTGRGKIEAKPPVQHRPSVVQVVIAQVPACVLAHQHRAQRPEREAGQQAAIADERPHQPAVSAASAGNAGQAR